MRKTDCYAKLHDLFVDPESVGVVTIDDRIWMIDRYVIVAASAAGVAPAIEGLEDGWYAVRRSCPPRRTGVWGLDSDGDVEKFRASVTKLIRPWAEWAVGPLEATEWAVTTIGRDGSHYHARVLLDHAGRPSCINSDLLARWQRHLGELALVQPPGEPGKPIKVCRQASYQSQANGYQAVERIIGWIMPVKVPDGLPEKLDLPRTAT